MQYFFVICCVILTAADCFSQRTATALRITNPPKIDGVLDETIWGEAPIIHEFTQFEPEQHKPALFDTEVRIVYDNAAVYVAAKLIDDEPDKILTELGSRDDLDVNADWFAVIFDTFNDDQNAFSFFVTAAGVQTDIKYSNRSQEDDNWNAVWESAVKIGNNGWFVEFKIPYSAIRFPNTEVQSWGLNFVRNNRRFREKSTWNAIDPDIDGLINQSGALQDLTAIESPLRLAFTPFLSTDVTKITTLDADFGYNTGMDVKYGINESFTLDMTLIPDFGEVKSDDQILNLGPFEQTFDENRDFFTEGTELFNRNNLFYSRRIGQLARGFVNLEDELNTNEIVTENPSEAKLLNAVKVSGRTASKYGIGIFNAFTQRTQATVLDTITNTNRSLTTSPFTNFNIISIEKNLKNTSLINFINTNVLRSDKGSNANVTGVGARIADKENKYAVSSRINVSQVFNYKTIDNNYQSTTGYNSYIRAGKVSGKVQYFLWNSIESDEYNPNDLGLLFSANEFNYGMWASYNINEQTDHLQYFTVQLNLNNQNLYKPFEYVGSTARAFVLATFKDYTTLRHQIFARPNGTKDYYEPRTNDFETYFQKPERYLITFGGSTDYRKPLAIDFSFGHQFANNKDLHFEDYGFSLSPRFRFNDKFSIESGASFFHFPTDYGFVENTGISIVFGKRNRKRTTLFAEAGYSFNENMNINLSSRYFWDKGTYKNFYTLENEGQLSPLTNYGGVDDFNFSAFNLDAVFRWRFAPGSDLNLIYKNAFAEFVNEPRTGLFENISDSFEEDKTNLLAVKVLYYLDYTQLKNWFNKKKIIIHSDR